MQQEIKVRELAEQFFKEEINKLDDPQRREEVEYEEETYIGVWMMGYRAGETQHPAGSEWVKNALQWAKEAIECANDHMHCPPCWVETWGNHYMNAMAAIQQAQVELEPNGEAAKAAQEAFLPGQSKNEPEQKEAVDS
jgi:hypothetical protein